MQRLGRRPVQTYPQRRPSRSVPTAGWIRGCNRRGLREGGREVAGGERRARRRPRRASDLRSGMQPPRGRCPTRRSGATVAAGTGASSAAAAAASASRAGSPRTRAAARVASSAARATRSARASEGKWKASDDAGSTYVVDPPGPGTANAKPSHLGVGGSNPSGRATAKSPAGARDPGGDRRAGNASEVALEAYGSGLLGDSAARAIFDRTGARRGILPVS